MPEPLTSAFNTAAVVRYVLRNHPEQSDSLLNGMERILGASPEEAQAALMAKGGWVPLEAFTVLLKRAQADIFKEPLTPFRIGFEAMTYKNWDVGARLLFRVLCHPRPLLHLGGWFIKRYSQQIAELKPSNFTKDGCDLEIRWRPSEHLSNNNCLYFQGIMAGIPINWGKPPAKVEELACQFEGNPSCRLRLRWTGLGLKQWLKVILTGPMAKNSRALLDTIQDNTLNLARLNSNLMAARSSYRAVVESAPDAICELWPDEKLLPLNQRCQEIVDAGRREGDLKLASLVHPEDLPGLRQKLDQGPHKNGDVIIHRFRLLDRDHRVKRVEASFTRVLKPERRSVSLGILRDMDSHEELSRALAEQRMRFEVLAEHSPLGLAFIDEAGNYLYTNPRFKEIFGYDRQEVESGGRWFDLVFPDPKTRSKVINAWMQDRTSTGSAAERFRIFTVTCKNGRQKDILFRPVTLPGGQQLVTYEDVTERNRLENERQEAARLAGVVELAGAAAHELNQPLTSLLASSELMLMYNQPEDLQRQAKRMRMDAQNLAQLVERFGRIVRYETKEYLPGRKIIDLERAAPGAGKSALKPGPKGTNG